MILANPILTPTSLRSYSYIITFCMLLLLSCTQVTKDGLPVVPWGGVKIFQV
jgi:hypothetical protein